MFGLAFFILLIILFIIGTNKKYNEMNMLDFLLDVIALQVLIYTVLKSIKSIF